MLNTMNLFPARPAAALAALFLTATPTIWAAEANNPYLGDWALTIPGGGAGWLRVTQEKGYYDADILWGSGSVVPVASVVIDNDTLFVTRVTPVARKNAQGKTIRTHQFTELMVAKADGDDLKLTTMQGRRDGQGFSRAEFTGKRIPALPPAPDLARVKWGSPQRLFNGQNLDGWRLINPGNANGWSARDGVLVNHPEQPAGQPHRSYGNLRTDAEFEDFNLTLETKVNAEDNSGIYLRGIYEIQVMNSFGAPLDSHNMGAVYSRIAPTLSAEKPAGEWQTLDLTLVDRHVTVILNGKKIIDNQPLPGCTGGALWSDPIRPGPLYLQGDHTGIAYRNIVLKPVVK